MTDKKRPDILEIWDEIQHDPLTIPPADFTGMTTDDAVDAIKEWFGENFEDPAQSTPYESAEGGYQYIWGGPYETRDIIENVFADAASQEIIDAAISELDGISTDWVPNSRRLQPPEDDEEPSPDNELDPAALHAQLQQRVKDLEETLGRIKELPPGIGHNRPPEPLDPEPLDEKDRQEIATALQTLKAQPVEPLDKGAAAEAALVQIESKRAKLGKWLAKQGDLFVTEAVKEAGKWAPRVIYYLFADHLFGLTQIIQKWLHAIQPPF